MHGRKHWLKSWPMRYAAARARCLLPSEEPLKNKVTGYRARCDFHGKRLTKTTSGKASLPAPPPAPSPPDPASGHASPQLSGPLVSRRGQDLGHGSFPDSGRQHGRQDKFGHHLIYLGVGVGRAVGGGRYHHDQRLVPEHEDLVAAVARAVEGVAQE